MILQALYDYYQRKAADPESGIAPEGFEWKEIPFVIVIDKNGNFVAIEDTREGEGKKKRARATLVPQGQKKAAGVKANLLWDNVEYAVGANPRNREDIEQRRAAFIRRIREELPSADARTMALLAFLEHEPNAQIAGAKDAVHLWNEALDSNANVTFRMDGDTHANLCHAFFSALASPRVATSDAGFCLASGTVGPTSRIHPSLKGVRGAQSSGAALISFNLAPFTSFGKAQNYNAPISEAGTFSYTTALNYLLARDSKQKLQVGDATTVFWAEKSASLEDSFAAFFEMPPKDDPDRDVAAVHALYSRLHTGAGTPDSKTRFFVLGLAPNAARIAVRFWHQGTVEEFSVRLKQHFDDLEIVRSPKDTGRYALFWLLVEIASERKIDNVPPNLAGDLVRSVLEGRPYPLTLLHQTMRRIRAEQKVTRMRAGILKATLNRFYRVHPTTQKEILVSLDLTNENPGYRLGRLFAVLEKIQEDAQPGINATIRDRFYGAASASPVTVFPRLLKLAHHHQSKIKSDRPGYAINNDKWLGEIMSGIPASMPAQLAMEDQARFAIGYYHQRQAFFTKSTATEPAKENS